jgi:hypothetical protein
MITTKKSLSFKEALLGVLTVINPIAGELLSSRAHFLFGFTL